MFDVDTMYVMHYDLNINTGGGNITSPLRVATLGVFL